MMGNKISSVRKSLVRPWCFVAMERELKTQPRIFDILPVKYEIDNNWVMINGHCHIQLMPQEVSLDFKVTLVGDNISFYLCDVTHRSRYSPIFELMSEQILLPLLGCSKIALSDGIVHYFNDDEMYLRIASGQTGKIWFIEDNKLSLFTYSTGIHDWNIMMTDQNTWSTGHL